MGLFMYEYKYFSCIYMKNTLKKWGTASVCICKLMQVFNEFYKPLQDIMIGIFYETSY